ncbi:MAG: flagellar hook-basal body complex protein FliE [Pseudomonadales bacterium]|jgi:flagellar hook-basal body complex protein FliE
MSNMDVSQVLAQIRTMNASASQLEQTNVNKPDFGELLKQSIDQVSETQQHAKDLSKAFQMGDKDVQLPEVMIAMQKASISFEAMSQVRNKLLSAYREIMNMPV